MKSFHAVMALRRHSIFRNGFPSKLYQYQARKSVRVGVYYPVSRITDDAFSLVHQTIVAFVYEDEDDQSSGGFTHERAPRSVPL